jgi:hypothetical protein
MTPPRTWAVLVTLYVLFFGWYTSFGGPLAPDEIEHYVRFMQEHGADPERVALWKRFMETDTGDDFAMMNYLDLRDAPEPGPGVSPGDTSEDVMARYVRPFMAQAMQSAAHPVLMGSAASLALDLWGIEGAESWTTGGVVRYRSRRDIMEQIVYAFDLDIHAFKIAALEKTVAFPIDPWFHLGDPRLVLGLVFTLLGLGFHLRAVTLTAL